MTDHLRPWKSNSYKSTALVITAQNLEAGTEQGGAPMVLQLWLDYNSHNPALVGWGWWELASSNNWRTTGFFSIGLLRIHFHSLGFCFLPFFPFAKERRISNPQQWRQTKWTVFAVNLRNRRGNRAGSSFCDNKFLPGQMVKDIWPSHTL